MPDGRNGRSKSVDTGGLKRVYIVHLGWPIVCIFYVLPIQDRETRLVP